MLTLTYEKTLQVQGKAACTPTQLIRSYYGPLP